jgi:hypothetical protein
LTNNIQDGHEKMSGKKYSVKSLSNNPVTVSNVTAHQVGRSYGAHKVSNHSIPANICNFKEVVLAPFVACCSTQMDQKYVPWYKQ